MNELKQKIKKNGFIYFLIHRTKEVAIYVQYDGGRMAAFEVFEIVVKKETRFKDVVIPKREKFPSNVDFGEKAFSVPCLSRAIKRAYQLQKRILKRTNSRAPNYFASLINNPAT